jgi:hypothetical protein
MIRATIVPGCPSRLLCPRQMLTSSGDPNTKISVRSADVKMRFRGSTFTIPYSNTTKNLPILRTAYTLTCYAAYCKAQNIPVHPAVLLITNTTQGPKKVSFATPTIANKLSATQKEKLLWYQCLNHVNFDQLSSWMRSGLLPVKEAVACAPAPMCTVCQFGKARWRSHAGCDGNITLHHDKPGAGISANQLEAGCPGIIPTTKGMPISQKYRYCNICIDHFSHLIYVIMHSKKDAKELLHSKTSFENFCT